ncbi:unnamed protein product [Camellia sinensis]
MVRSWVRPPRRLHLHGHRPSSSVDLHILSRHHRSNMMMHGTDDTHPDPNLDLSNLSSLSSEKMATSLRAPMATSVPSSSSSRSLKRRSFQTLCATNSRNGAKIPMPLVNLPRSWLLLPGPTGSPICFLLAQVRQRGRKRTTIG